jgi:hypothetical protein
MTTTIYRAKRERNINATANSRTLTMTDTRTFRTEEEAVEQLMAWEKEMEAKGWAMAYNFGHEDIIRMKMVNDHNVTSFAKLYIITSCK